MSEPAPRSSVLDEPGTGSSPSLMERDAELSEITARLEAARSGAGGLTIIEGPAGIGKSSLLQAAAACAHRSEMAVLAASGDHLEREYPFGLARSLFEPSLAAALSRRRGELLAGGAWFAGPALGMEPPERSAATAGQAPFAALHGLHRLSVTLSEQRPLLIIVDDAHWADAASLRWLAYLGRRLHNARIAVLAAVGVGEPAAGGDELLAAICAQPGACAIRPRPLSQAATAAVVGAALDAVPAPAFARSCQLTTGGNPFLVHQLARALAADGIAPLAGAADGVLRLGPATVARTLFLRLARLPPAAAAVAQAVAVLGSGAEPPLTAALAGCTPAAAADAADALARAAILRPDRPLAFVHPIVQSAVYADIGAARRGERHRRAARLLARAGAEPARVASHLLATEPAADPWVTRTLLDAGRDARARGALEEAATFMRRALDEPPPAALRADVLLELGLAETALMQLPAAIEHLTQAGAATDDPAAQARIALVLTPALFSTADAGAAMAQIDAAIERLGASEPELTTLLAAQLLHVGRIELTCRRLALPRVELESDRAPAATPAERARLGNIAIESIMAGRPAADAARMAEQVLADGLNASGDGDVPTVFLATLRVLTMADRYEQAQRLIDEVIADARARGSLPTFATASAFRSELAYRRGRLADARADAQAALDVALDNDWPIGLPACVAHAIDALLEYGELTAARELLTRCRLDGELPPVITCNPLLDSRGRLRLAEGDPPGALEDLLECGRRMEEWGDRVSVAWRASAALACRRLGDSTRARAFAAQELEHARTLGAPRALGIALRTGGLVAPNDDSVALLHEAVAALADSGARLEHARALVDLGAALRRRGARASAREPLRRGLDLAHRCEARVLERRARDELAASGARPRRARIDGRDALTPSERRVAEMASGAMSNRDIAQALFVTVRTVETHLSHVYRKLDVRSRADLAATLARTSNP